LKKWMLGVVGDPDDAPADRVLLVAEFSVLANSLKPGKTTKAQFVLRPASTTASKAFQFVVVGVSTPADIAVGKAT